MRIDTLFFFYKLSTNFCEVSSFSRCEFRLSRYKVGGSLVAIEFKDLFKVDPKPEMVDDAVRFIHRCKRCEWPRLHESPHFKESERSIMIDVCSHILVPMCDGVILERRYREALAKMPHTSIRCGNIGLGTPDTWHGSPDVRVRAGEVRVNLLYIRWRW